MKVLELAKRRGFFWGSYEIYEGLAGFFDYGPVGTILKHRIEDVWRNFYRMEGFIEIETPAIAPKEVFEASGHLQHFLDMVVRCKKCGSLFKAGEINCPECGGELAREKEASLMLRTSIGVGEGREAYLRPETAQGIFVCFRRLLNLSRGKLPFGVMQVGRAYRNEISPRQGMLRLREFNMAEVEIFVDPSRKNEHPKFDDVRGLEIRVVPWNGGEKKMKVGDMVADGIFPHQYLAYHVARAKQFLNMIGFQDDRIRFRQHSPDERAHYAQDCWDGEILTNSFGWIEVVGIADRGDYDLRAHEGRSGEKMRVDDVIPHVIEPSYGIDRIVYALLDCCYEDGERKLLKFSPLVAPVQVAVLPLLSRDELERKAMEVYEILREKFVAEYDSSGSIGRRYRRYDEIGTPYCVTIDYQTLSDDTVTIRDRDSMKQKRVEIGKLSEELSALLKKEKAEI